MKKMKTPLILLFAFCLIAAGASLPGIVSAVQDSAAASVSYDSMQPVTLDLSGERQSLSTIGKQVLLSKANPIPVTEDETGMTEADAYAAVQAHMDRFAAAGIFEWFDITLQHAQPNLCIDPDQTENYVIFWTVTFINKNEPYHTLTVDIDDETGQVLALNYDIYGSYEIDGVWERSYTTLNTFAEVYLGQLELPQSIYENNTAEYLELDGEVLCGRYTFADAEYGQHTIELYVTGSGSFWTYFS